MPVYTYRCGNCGVQFDRHQKFADSPLVKCPECGKKALKKVIAPVGVVFRGSGFYATDNRSPSGGGSRSGESKPGKSEAGEKSSSTETAPAKAESSKPEANF